MFIAVPIMAVGFVEYNGMSLEKYVFIIIMNAFIYPNKRKYRRKNEVEVLLNDIQKEREREIKLSKREKEGKKQETT